MSAAVACPTCGTSLKVPTPLTADKLMRCPKCQNTFLLTMQAPTSSPPAAPRQPAPPPPSRPAPRPKKRRRYEDDDDDWPRRKTSSSSGMGALAWILIIGGMLFVLGLFCCGGVGLFMHLGMQEFEREARRERERDIERRAGPMAIQPQEPEMPRPRARPEEEQPDDDTPPGEDPPPPPPALNRPARPSVPSHPAFDPPVRPLAPGQKQVIFRIAVMPAGNPVHLAREALGNIHWIDRETIECDRNARELRFGVIGSNVNSTDAKTALEAEGFKLSGVTVITPKGK